MTGVKHFVNVAQEHEARAGITVLQSISTVAPHFGGPAIQALALDAALYRQGAESRIVTIAYADASGRSLTADERRDIAAEAHEVVWLEPRWPYRLEGSRGTLTGLVRAVRDADFVVVHGQYLWVHIA